MSSPQILTNTTNKAGTCAHGLPPSACPICSGGMAGGAKRMNDMPATKPMRSGEWSYMKCYAAGMAMKAQNAREQNAKNFIEKQYEIAAKFKNAISDFSNRISEAVKALQNSLPSVISGVVQGVMNIVINPILNLVEKLPVLMEKFADLQQNIARFIQNIQDKMAAILGDIKNFINRNIVENFKKKAKKFFLFFMSGIEDENYQNDDTLFVFKSREIKKYLIKFVDGIIKRDESADKRDKNEKI